MAVKRHETPCSVKLSDELAGKLSAIAHEMRWKVPQKRALERGPMIGHLCRWFIEQSPEAQLGMIQEGKRLREEDEARYSQAEAPREDATSHSKAQPKKPRRKK